MKKSVLLLIALALAGSSCRRGLDHDQAVEPLTLSVTGTPYDEQELPSEPATDDAQAKASGLDAQWSKSSTPASRATDLKFQSEDQVGVYVHTKTGLTLPTTHSANMLYVTKDEGSTWRASNALSGPLTASAYYATGYYPYQSGLVDPLNVPHTIFADQSAVEGTTAGNMEKSDFMSVADVPMKSIGDNPSAELKFVHRMSKFAIKVSIPNYIDGIAVTKLKSVSVKNLRLTGKINLATGTPTVGAVVAGAPAITPRYISGTGTPGTISTYEAVVFPQSVATGVLLVEFMCTMASGADKPLSYTTPTTGGLTFESGKRLTLVLSSASDVAFMSDLDLLDGVKKTNEPLEIKVPKSALWTLTSPVDWLLLSTTANGAYSKTISGTGTGAIATVYVNVLANDAKPVESLKPREATLTLTAVTNPVSLPATYVAVQGYRRFETTSLNAVTIISDAPQPLPTVTSNQVWKLKAALPSWMKITRGKVKWAQANSGNTIDVSGEGYDVVGSIGSGIGANDLYIVASPNALSMMGTTVNTGATSHAVALSYGAEKTVIVYWTHSYSVGGTVWSAGNLVAANTAAQGAAAQGGARIGSMYDGGLYFKFGSLVGLKGGATGSGAGTAVDSHTTDYWLRPEGHTASTNWENAVYFNDASKTKGDFRNYIVGDNVSGNGIGDACRYYLGSPWRLPIGQEFAELTNKQNAVGINIGWAASGGKESSSTTSPSTKLYGGWWSGNATTAPAFASAIYFVGSGYRMDADGSLGTVGTGGLYWSSSISSASNSWNLNFAAGQVKQGSGSRIGGQALRCVQGVKVALSHDSGFSPVASSKHSLNLDLVGVDGAKWSLAESGDLAGAFTPSATSGIFGTNNTITVDVAENKSPSTRSVSYTLVMNGDPTQTSTLILEQSPAYIQVAGTRWATGNLIATSASAATAAKGTGARVGAPYDGGLYFKFGSLVGLKGGADGSGRGQAVATHDTGYWLRPTGNANTDWATAAYFQGTQTTGEFNALVADNATSGVGDACRFYLGDPWRLPTSAEHVALCNGKGGAGVNAGWANSGGKETTFPATALWGGWWSGSATTTPAFASAIYFVGSGCRHSGTGELISLGSRSSSWSSSIGSANTSLNLSFYTGIVQTQDNCNRSHSFPLRCVQGVTVDIALSKESGLSPVAASAHSITLNLTGVATQSWTLAESGDDLGAFTPNILAGKFGTNDAVTIQVASNLTDKLRTVSYTLTSQGSTATITLEQAPGYFEVSGTKWATGNLISVNSTAPNNSATGGARIGAPYDGGLYFRFGSLVGLKGGANGDGRGTAVATHDKKYWLRPTGHTTSDDWATAAYFDDAEKTSGDFKDYHPTDNADNDGIGDACRYYLGSPWRLPTGQEYGELCNNQQAAGEIPGWLASGGVWTDYSTTPATPLFGGWFSGKANTTPAFTSALYLVGSSRLSYLSGVVSFLGGEGIYWSSSVGNGLGVYLGFYSGSVNSQNSLSRTQGSAVRCVQGVAGTVKIAMSRASGFSPVASSKHSIVLDLTSDLTGSWTLTESGDAAGVFTPKATTGTFAANKTVTIDVAENKAAELRSVTYTLTSGGSSATITIEQAPAYFELNGTRWSTGNLVSDAAEPTAAGLGGARIGSPFDGGLYFKFGSLVGLKGGVDGSGRGQAMSNHDTGYWLRPTGHTASTDWATAAYFSNATKTSGDLRDYVTVDNKANDGIGDACRYYLGSSWRLPTGQEFGELANNQHAISYNVGWIGSGGTETSAPTTPLYGGWWSGNATTTPNFVSALYFVGSGYRSPTTGLLATVGAQGDTWSSSISSSTNSISTYFNVNAIIYINYSINKKHGFTLRCVQGVSVGLTRESGMSPVAASAHSVKLELVGEVGKTWSLSGNGNGFTASPTSGTFGASGNAYVTVTVAANATAVVRATTFKLISNGMTAETKIEQAPPYFELNGTRWATGNLVATSAAPADAAQGTGARIGAMYDGGLYFKFGSLVGLKGGYDGSGRGQAMTTHDKGYWLRPTGHTASTDWATAAYFSDNTKTTGDFKDYHPTDNAANDGIGDACRFYLGSSWRLPTAQEFGDLCNKQYTTSDVGWTATGGIETSPSSYPSTSIYGGWWSGTSSTTPALTSAIYFVGSGHMNFVAGARSVNNEGLCWSSTIRKHSFFYVGSVRAVSGNDGNTSTPLRCVQGVNVVIAAESGLQPVAASAHSVKLTLTGEANKPWTLSANGAGFTVATASGTFPASGTSTATINVAANAAATMRSATITLVSGGMSSILKIEQAPAYFQVGALKWATGNLVSDAAEPTTAGAGGARIGAPYDGGLYFRFGSLVGLKGGYDGSGRGQVMTTHDKGYWLRPTGHTASTDWATAAYFSDNTKTTGDFKDHHPTDNATNDGIGDACRFYLGSPWRLPTTAEFVALCNAKSGIDVNQDWAATGGVLTSPTTTPSASLFGAWFSGSANTTPAFASAIYFVGSGQRNLTNGSLGGVGTYGVYWSSSISAASFGLSLRFENTTYLKSQDLDTRTHGLTLRCVQ